MFGTEEIEKLKLRNESVKCFSLTGKVYVISKTDLIKRLDFFPNAIFELEKAIEKKNEFKN